MQQPHFWFQKNSLLSHLLLPLSGIWLLGTTIRKRFYTRKAVEKPVISIGNVNIGGTGKTPLAITLIQKLRDEGHNPHIVSRGYGGKLQGPIQVNEKEHSVRDVGDEALLLASFGPTWVARDRYMGAVSAVNEGASIVILDDGHQNLTLEPTLSIIVVDAVRGFGNKRVIPSGPLREPLSQALARVDMVVAVGTETQVERLQNHFGKDYDLPVIPARLTLLESGLSLDSQNVVAFAGIGDPSKFRATLNELGTNVIKFVPLDDHEVPAESFLLRLEGEARKSNALLITTEKDAVRLNPDWKKKVLTVPIRLELNDWDLFDTYFQSKAEGFVNSD